MQISYLRDLLEASVLCGEDRLEEDVSFVLSTAVSPFSDIVVTVRMNGCLTVNLRFRFPGNIFL